MTLQKEELTTDTSKLLILGSGSTARKELLISVGLIPNKIEIPDVDESVKLNESPHHYVRRVAKLKASAITCEKQAYLITADTTVTVGRRFLMKTYDEIKAEEYLRLLSGRRHSVFTAYCIKHNGLIISKSVKTILKMRLLTNREIKAYIDSRDWMGCAELQHSRQSTMFFPFISGCYSNVVGLPLPSIVGVLGAMGYYNK